MPCVLGFIGKPFQQCFQQILSPGADCLSELSWAVYYTIEQLSLALSLAFMSFPITLQHLTGLPEDCQAVCTHGMTACKSIIDGHKVLVSELT